MSVNGIQESLTPSYLIPKSKKGFVEHVKTSLHLTRHCDNRSHCTYLCLTQSLFGWLVSDRQQFLFIGCRCLRWPSLLMPVEIMHTIKLANVM